MSGPMHGAAAVPESMLDDSHPLIRGVYRPPAALSRWRLEQLVGHERVRYFSFGRHALVAALRLARVGAGDKVLLPSFICRELLSALHAVDATPEYYPVDRRLNPDRDLNGFPGAKAVIAVNYFGFPQDLAPFQAYCARSGAVLIEDNAHGLFSRDARAQPLGARGELGIYSLRKTLVTPDGAALAVNSPRLAAALAPQLAFERKAVPVSARVKNHLRRWVPWAGVGPARWATECARLARHIRSGHRISPSAADAEEVLPDGAAPAGALLDSMEHTDVGAECERRRSLYARMSGVLEPDRFPPVFDRMPDNTVPYGYPFVADEITAARAGTILAGVGLECFRWPELPQAVAPAAPAHYSSIWMASFLW